MHSPLFARACSRLLLSNVTEILQSNSDTIYELRTDVGADLASVQARFEERAHYLTIVEGAERNRVIRLGAEALVIGRAAESDLVIDDSELSRRHCVVQLVDERVIVTDLNATNGTYVDGMRVIGSTVLPLGGTLRTGRQLFQLGKRSIWEVEQSQALDRDLARASAYVKALLPPPLTHGSVQTDWLLVPSERLGGDAFGYGTIDEQTYFGYILDVSGHGAAAALHSISVMNILRQNVLPEADRRDPAAVLRTLNTMFPMHAHGGMFFTMWYGVFDVRTRVLSFCSAGHHPGFLVPRAKREAVPLRTRSPALGMTSDSAFKTDHIQVAPGSRLYLFSDGVYEITNAEGRRWQLADFISLILEPSLAGVGEAQRLYNAARAAALSGVFEDDVSLFVTSFV